MLKEPAHIRILKAVGAHSLGVGVVMAARIIYPPLFLRAWGVELYGEWLILSSAVLYLLLADLGGQLYIGNRLAEVYAKGDQKTFVKLLHTGMAMFLLVPSVMFLLFVAAVSYFPVWTTFSVAETPHQVVFWVLTLLALQVCISLPIGILMGVYRAVGMLPRSAMLNNLNQLLQLALVSTALWFGVGMTGIAVAHLAPVVIVAAISLGELHRLHPEFNIRSLRSADWKMAREFIKPSAHFFSIQISQALTMQSVLLIVGALLNSAQVVLFAALRTVANSIRQVLAILMNSVWPDMTRLYAMDESGKLVMLFHVMLRATLVASVIFIGIFHYLGERIFELWLGKQVGYRQILMDLFLIYAFQFVFWTSCSNLLMAINRHHEISVLLLVSAVVTVVCVFFGGKQFGLAGVIGGLVAADLILPFWAVPMLLRKYVPSFSARFYLGEIVPALLAIGLIMWTPWTIPVVGAGLLIWLVRVFPRNSVLGRWRIRWKND